MPAPASATAKRSQLVKACTTSSGDSATMAASHRRRPARRKVLQVTTSMQMASSSAVTEKYARISVASGSSEPSAQATYAFASAADSPMKPPVRTGYSTGWSAYGTAPLSSCSV